MLRPIHKTGCFKDTWRYLKFENQRARWAPLMTVIMYSDAWSLVDMERWSVKHRIAAVELFVNIESVTATQRGFRQQFQRCDSYGRNTLLLWVSKWCQEGSVEDSKPQGWPVSAHTPDNVGTVMDAMLRSPGRSARRQALALRLKEFSVCRILHEGLHYHPYKIQVAQELSERDKVSRLHFCSELGDKQ
jgi:hypothetical protein